MSIRPSLVDGDTLLIDLKNPVRSLGTTIYGGGLNHIGSVIFRRVDKCFSNPSPHSYAREIARSLGRESSAVFLTAVDVSRYIYSRAEDSGISVEGIATIGLTHPACIGGEPWGGGIGTINIFILTSVGLSNTGLADLLRTVSEVKAGYLSILGLSCGGLPAVGTVSDATLVASPGGSIDYAGLGTPVGRLVSRVLRDIFRSYMSSRGLDDYIRYMGYEDGGNIDPRRAMLKRLELLVEEMMSIDIIPWLDRGALEEILKHIRRISHE